MILQILVIGMLCALNLSCKARTSNSAAKSDVAIPYTARPGTNLYLFKIPNLPVICRGLCSIDPTTISDAAARRQACSRENFMITLDDLELAKVADDKQQQLFSQLVAELKSDRDSGKGSLVFKPEYEPLVKNITDRIYAKGIKDGCSKWIGGDAPTSDAPVQTRDEPTQTSQGNCVGSGLFKYCVGDTIYHIEGKTGRIHAIFGDERVAWKDSYSGANYTSVATSLAVGKGCSTSTPSFCVGNAIVHEDGRTGVILALVQDGTMMWKDSNSGAIYASIAKKLAVMKK